MQGEAGLENDTIVDCQLDTARSSTDTSIPTQGHAANAANDSVRCCQIGLANKHLAGWEDSDLNEVGMPARR